MRHLLPVLMIAALLPAGISLALAEDAKTDQKTDVQTPVQLRAELHRTVADLVEARSAKTPDEAKINALLDKVQYLRNQIRSQNVAPDWRARPLSGQCPWGGPAMGRGMGPGKGYGYAQGRGRGGPGWANGAGKGRGQGGPAWAYGAGYGAGRGRGMCYAAAGVNCPQNCPACCQNCTCKNCPRDCADCKCCQNGQACGKNCATCPLRGCAGRCNLNLDPLGGYLGGDAGPPIPPAKPAQTGN